MIVLVFTLADICLCADMNNREPRLFKSVLIINMDVKDNHEEASIGAKLALDLCQKVFEQHYIYSVHSYSFHWFLITSKHISLCGYLEIDFVNKRADCYS